MIERAISAATHGRYLVDAPASAAPRPLLVGFHGYAEAAETQLERLRSIPGSDRWLLVAVQGLNRFYRGRSSDVVASWMTRQDRELAIADNVAYVGAVVDLVSREWSVDGRVAFAGFRRASRWRSAAAAAGDGRRVIAVGGDVPPELDRAALARIPAVLIARGSRDGLYSEQTFESDVLRLRAAGARVDAVALDADHEWTEEFSRAVAVFLKEWR